MSILSLACTRNGIAIVHTKGKREDFEIVFHSLLALVPGDWVGLVNALESMLKSRISADRPSLVIIVKAATGQYSASADTFKAEGFAEYVLARMGVKHISVTKHSLPKCLACSGKEKWQSKAKEMFNSDQTIKGFQSGFDAACAAAFGHSK